MLSIPTAAAKLVADAEAAGFTTEVKQYRDSVEVHVSYPGSKRGGYAIWSVKNTAGNCRLGFPTSYTPGVRFDYATATTYSGEHKSPRSAREFRYTVGIPT